MLFNIFKNVINCIEGILVDPNIITTVIDITIFYINELYIIVILTNMLRKCNTN